jgi:hypothetical protein
MTGSYQLVENINFEAFLAAQGVPWALRSAANRARPIHKLTHEGNVITIQICGLIDIPPTTYYIDGPPSTCQVRGREFSDTVTYLKDGSGIQVLKHAVNDHYKISVVRQWSSSASTPHHYPNRCLTVTSTAMFDAAYVDGPKDPIQCIQHFERIS